MLSGVEIAAAGSANDRTFRSRWRERPRGGATERLLVADDAARPGCVTVLSPIDGGGPVRLVDSGALGDLLRRVAGRSRLEVVRELAGELDRLDLAGIPGLKVRELLTFHTLTGRVRTDPDRWSSLEASSKAIAHGADWRSVLTALGYQIERRPNRGIVEEHNRLSDSRAMGEHRAGATIRARHPARTPPCSCPRTQIGPRKP